MNAFKKIRWIPLLVIIFTVILIAVGWAFPGTNVLSWLTLGVGLGIVSLLAAKDPLAEQVFIMAFLIRAIFALVHRYIVPLPYSQADAITFERLAEEWAGGELGHVLSQFQSGAYLYS